MYKLCVYQDGSLHDSGFYSNHREVMILAKAWVYLKGHTATVAKNGCIFAWFNRPCRLYSSD